MYYDLGLIYFELYAITKKYYDKVEK